MLGLATTKDLELVEKRVKNLKVNEKDIRDLTDEVAKLQNSLRLMVKKVQQLEKDNKTLMGMHIVKVEDEPKPKKVATKTIKPRKKATKKEVK